MEGPAVEEAPGGLRSAAALLRKTLLWNPPVDCAEMQYPCGLQRVAVEEGPCGLWRAAVEAFSKEAPMAALTVERCRERPCCGSSL